MREGHASGRAPSRQAHDVRGGRVVAVLAAIVCLLFVLTLRDVAVHPLVAAAFTAPALPWSPSDRDAALTVGLVDEAGHPWPGASVRVFAMRDGKAYFAGDRSSDREGRASFTRLPRGEVWILAYGAGRARASSNVVLSGGLREVPLVLRPARALDVVVVNDADEPVSGAAIEVLTADPLPYAAVTTADGRARVDRLGPSPYRVRVWAAGYEEVIRAGVVPTPAPLRIRLERPATIDVSVVDTEGHPASTATVLASGTGLWPARSGLTDERGILRIGGLHGGVYDLQARRGTEVSATELALPVARGETKEVKLTLQPGKQVRVNVIDGVDGDPSGPPVGSADVVLAPEGLSAFPVEGRTDARGVVELGPVARVGATVSVRARGFVSRTTRLEASKTEATIALVRGGVIEGSVVDDRGFPVGGASVEVIGVDAEGMPIDETAAMIDFRDQRFDLTLPGPSPLIPVGELGVMPGVIPDFPHVPSGAGAAQTGATSGPMSSTRALPAPDPWVTRSDGTFRCDPVSPGRVQVIVRHPRYVESVSDLVTVQSGGTTTVHVVLRQGGFIEGRVLEEDRTPVRGARIELAASHGALDVVAYAADDGTFTFASAPDEVLLSAARPDAPGDVVAQVTLAVPDRDRATVEIILPKPRDSIRIHVTDDRGYPVDRVELRALSLDLAVPLRRTLFTTEGGDCVLPDAVGLPLRFTAVRPGKAPLTRVVDAAPSQLDLTMTEGLEGRGRVTAREGRDRVADVDVTLFSTSGARHARTDAEGSFTVKDLAPGRLRVRARHPSYAPLERVLTVVGDRDRVVDLGTLDLTEAGDAEGEVVDADDHAVAGARVARDAVPTYLPLGPLPPDIVTTDREGRFKLGGLPEGKVTLEAYFTDLGRGRAEDIVVRAGRTTERVKITLEGGATGHEAKGAGSVAVTLGEHGRTVVVLLVSPGSEAEAAGIEPADEIASIDGHEVHDIEAARKLLTGPLGEDVIVALRRDDDANKTSVVRVRRERVRR